MEKPLSKTTVLHHSQVVVMVRAGVGFLINNERFTVKLLQNGEWRLNTNIHTHLFSLSIQPLFNCDRGDQYSTNSQPVTSVQVATLPLFFFCQRKGYRRPKVSSKADEIMDTMDCLKVSDCIGGYPSNSKSMQYTTLMFPLEEARTSSSIPLTVDMGGSSEATI